MSAPQPLRVAHLSSYLRELISDVAAQGKVVKIDGNAVQVAAVALMSGSIAVVETFWKDVMFLAGDAKVRVKDVARPAVEQLASRGAGFLLDKLFPAKR